MDRAMGVYMGIFGNVPKVSVYLSMPTDANGALPDGSKNAYTLHIHERPDAAGEILLVDHHVLPCRIATSWRTRSSVIRSAAARPA